jgi:multiple sugar transport system substrate-binding protein
MRPNDVMRIAIRKFGPFEMAIQKQYADFQAATGCPLKLEFEALDLNPLYDSLFNQGGLKDGSFDIAFINTDWLAEGVNQAAFVNLSPLMRAEPIPDYPGGWPPALTRLQQFEEAVYGLPYHDGPECFIYRRDLFEDPAEQAAFRARYGYDLGIPRTWSQFEDIAHFFTRPEQDLFGTVFAAFPDGHNTVYDFCIQLWSRGGDLLDKAGQPTLNTAQATAALDFYRKVIKDPGMTPPGLQEIDSVRSGELFASGRVAMMVNWFGFAAVGELPGSPVKGKVDVAPLPGSDQAGNAALNVYWVLAIGSGSPYVNEAYAFLRHLGRPEMDRLTTLEGGIGCRFSTWRDPEVNRAIPFYYRLAELHRSMRELPRSRYFPELAHIIDQAVQRALDSDLATPDILAEAQLKAAAIRL